MALFRGAQARASRVVAAARAAAGAEELPAPLVDLLVRMYDFADEALPALNAAAGDPAIGASALVMVRTLSTGLAGMLSAIGPRPSRKGQAGHVYLIECAGRLKIGWSVNVDARRAELQTGAPFPLAVLATFPGTREDEGATHRLFASARLIGEWFSGDIREAALAVFRARGAA